MDAIVITIENLNPDTLPEIEKGDASYVHEIAKIVVDTKIGDCRPSSIRCRNLTTRDTAYHCLEFGHGNSISCPYFSNVEGRCLINKFYELAKELTNIKSKHQK